MQAQPGLTASKPRIAAPQPGAGQRMKSVLLKGTVGGALLASTLWLGGCATEDYVDKSVAAVRMDLSATQQQVQAQGAKLGEHDAHLAKLDGDVAAVNAKADEAAKLAAGKFNATQVAVESVNFKTGSYVLSPEDQDKLTALAGRLKSDDKNVKLEILGHTDSVGSPRSNYRLATMRAQAVFDFLGNQGVPLNNMEMLAQGENKPVADNKTGDGRAQNRRVDVSIVN